jgi:Flp pilus assembly protein TadD
MATPQTARAAHGAAPELVAKGARFERAGDFDAAIAAYEAALGLAPDDPDIVARLALLAHRMELREVAAELWARVIALDPARLQAIDGRARALRETGAFAEAIALLREALLAHPQEQRLWNSLGVTLTQDSQAERALTFLDEAIRLDGRYAAAIYNRGAAWFDLGGLEAADSDFTLARKLARDPAEIATIAFAQATLALARGDLAAGWDGYETRLSPRWPGAVRFEAPGRRWTPDEPLAGKHLLVVGEQGLGDELMFAGVLPDVLTALGGDGRLSLAVEPRLVELFRRSFPAAGVSAHATDRQGPRRRRSAAAPDSRRPVDLWAPMGSLPRAFRRSLAAFPDRPGYLQPDPARVAHWRAWLGEGPPTVGVTWRSGKVTGDRRRQYPPLGLWGPMMAIGGVRFVNLQYGEAGEDLAALAGFAGRPLLEAPSLDLREDIEGLAALIAALDLTISVSNATGALAGACGSRLVLLSPPANWTYLGTRRQPWFPAAEALSAPAFGEWALVMAAAAARVAMLARAG